MTQWSADWKLANLKRRFVFSILDFLPMQLLLENKLNIYLL